MVSCRIETLLEPVIAIIAEVESLCVCFCTTRVYRERRAFGRNIAKGWLRGTDNVRTARGDACVTGISHQIRHI